MITTANLELDNKTIPVSRESEMMVLGCMLTREDALKIATDSLNDFDFFYSENKIVFQILKHASQQNKPTDVHLMAEELKRRDQLKAVGGYGYLVSLAQYAGTSAHIEEYVSIVRNQSLLRRGIQMAQTFESDALKNPENIGAIIDKHIEQWSTIQRTSIGELPISSMEDYLIDLKSHIDPYRGGKYVGLCLDTLPFINEKLSGLRELILLAAPPNVGKTALIMQMVVDALRKNNDACAVVVSLEMSRNQLLTRIHCSFCGLTWKDFVFGTAKQDRDLNPEAYFTKEQLTKLNDAARILRNDIGNRLQILDREQCAYIDTRRVINLAERLKEKTGCSRALIAIDYLQVWPLNPAVRPISELELDKWRIGEMKKIRDSLNGDPVLVISEARKPSGKEDAWGGEMSDVMGSARGTYTPDCVWLLQETSPLELSKFLDPKVKHTKPTEQAEKIIEMKQASGCCLRTFKMVKGRDGMDKFSQILEFNFRTNTFKTYIHK